MVELMRIWAGKGPQFGNARAARNVYEETVHNVMSRTGGYDNPTREQLTTVLPEDIPEPSSPVKANGSNGAGGFAHERGAPRSQAPKQEGKSRGFKKSESRGKEAGHRGKVRNSHSAVPSCYNASMGLRSKGKGRKPGPPKDELPALKVRLRGKDKSALSMQQLGEGLFEAARILKQYESGYRIKSATIYLTIDRRTRDARAHQ